MNWIKENKIKIIIIAVAVVLLAGISTVIAVTNKSARAQTTDNSLQFPMRKEQKHQRMLAGK